MNDDHTLAIIKDRLAQARDGLGEVPEPTPVGKIIARAGQRRARRRLAAAGAACAAAGLAAVLIFAAGNPARPAPRPGPGHAQLAAWTVRTNPDGTVTFTLRNTSHPAQLERALAKAGVPAVVRWGEICEAGGPGQPLIDTSGFVTGSNMFTADVASFFAANGGHGVNVDLGWSWTVIPGKIPHGGQFVISAVPGPVPADDFQAVWEFVHTSAPITCAKRVDK